MLTTSFELPTTMQDILVTLGQLLCITFKRVKDQNLPKAIVVVTLHCLGHWLRTLLCHQLGVAKGIKQVINPACYSS